MNAPFVFPAPNGHRNFNQRFTDMLSTRANYWGEVALDVAVMIGLALAGWYEHAGGLGAALAALLLGLFAFSFIEYFFHRWLFHTRLPLFSEGHQKHHHNPLGYDSLPFFLPALVIFGLAGLGSLVMPLGLALWVAGVIDLGYIIYGLSHFTIHRKRFRNPWLRRWAASHHIHHHHPESNFGVTTPLWDFLLGTRYKRSS